MTPAVINDYLYTSAKEYQIQIPEMYMKSLLINDYFIRTAREFYIL